MMIISSIRTKEKITLALFALIVMLFAAGLPMSVASPGYANADVVKSLRNRDESPFESFRANLPLLLEIGAEPSITTYLLTDIYMANARYCGISNPKTVQKRE